MQSSSPLVAVSATVLKQVARRLRGWCAGIANRESTSTTAPLLDRATCLNGNGRRQIPCAVLRKSAGATRNRRCCRKNIFGACKRRNHLRAGRRDSGNAICAHCIARACDARRMHKTRRFFAIAKMMTRIWRNDRRFAARIRLAATESAPGRAWKKFAPGC